MQIRVSEESTEFTEFGLFSFEGDEFGVDLSGGFRHFSFSLPGSLLREKRSSVAGFTTEYTTFRSFIPTPASNLVKRSKF